MGLEDDGMYWLAGVPHHPAFLRENGLVPASEVREALRRGVVAGLNAADMHGRAAGIVLGLPSPTEVLRTVAAPQRDAGNEGGIKQ